MAVYDRNRGIPGAKKNLWFSYTITEEQRLRYGLKTRTVREPSPENNERVAKAHLAQRKREVVDGSWRPKADGGSTGGATFEAFADAWIAQREKDGVKSVRNERQRLRDYVYPAIGAKRLAEVRRADILRLVSDFRNSVLKATGEKPAPRMVHRVYEDVRTLFARAVEDEVLPATPCTLKVRRGELPKKKDADPRWRSGAIFSRDEVETLISSDEIEWPRRMVYGLLFLTGARIGEVAGMLWRDYDVRLKPLGKLTVATTYGGGETKTETTREVPVHPTLAVMLAEWKREGFAVWLGRHPTPDDHIVPRFHNRANGRRPDPVPYLSAKTVHRQLQRDLAMLGLRPRRVHDSRRAFISLARADGANKDILNWITHGPSDDDMQDLYTTFPWETFCEQVNFLRIQRRSIAQVVALRPTISADSV